MVTFVVFCLEHSRLDHPWGMSCSALAVIQTTSPFRRMRTTSVPQMVKYWTRRTTSRKEPNRSQTSGTSMLKIGRREDV